ncbi:hypothetical protein pb186bvf_014874 [Paramecium bursaria]
MSDSDDSLNDSLKPSQLRRLEAEFETNKLGSNKYNTYRLSYSSEEKDNHQTFRIIESQLKQVQDLVEVNDYTSANKQLQSLSQQKQNFSDKDQIYYHYLQACVFYNLDQYQQLFNQAPKLLNKSFEQFDHLLEMLVDAYIKTNKLQQALDLLLQLINRNQLNNDYQVQLGELYLKLNKPQQAFYSYLHAFNNGMSDLLEIVTELSHSVNIQQFILFAKEYIQQDEKNPVKYSKILQLLAKELYPDRQCLLYQDQVCQFMVQSNGLRNQETFLAVVNYAELLLNFEQYEDAYNNFDTAAQITLQISGQTKEYMVCLYKQGFCLKKMNHLKEALPFLEKSYSVASHILGHAHQFTQRLIFNMAFMRIQLSQDYKNYVNLLLVNGDSLLLNELGTLLSGESALQCYEKALERATKEQSIIINLNLGQCYTSIKDYQRAINIYTQLKQMVDVSGQADLELKIGQVYKACGKLREAMFHMKKALTQANSQGQDSQHILNEINQI